MCSLAVFVGSAKGHGGVVQGEYGQSGTRRSRSLLSVLESKNISAVLGPLPSVPGSHVRHPIMFIRVQSGSCSTLLNRAHPIQGSHDTDFTVGE